MAMMQPAVGDYRDGFGPAFPTVICYFFERPLQPDGQCLAAFASRWRQQAGRIHPMAVSGIVFELLVCFPLEQAEILLRQRRQGDRHQHGIQDLRRLQAAEERAGVQRLGAGVRMGSLPFGQFPPAPVAQRGFSLCPI